MFVSFVFSLREGWRFVIQNFSRRWIDWTEVIRNTGPFFCAVRSSASFPVVLGNFVYDVTCLACRKNSRQALDSKSPLLTRIAQTGLGTRLWSPKVDVKPRRVEIPCAFHFSHLDKYGISTLPSLNCPFFLSFSFSLLIFCETGLFLSESRWHFNFYLRTLSSVIFTL